MFRRFSSKRVLDALQDTPVVLIQGPRQSGKSTLAQQIAKDQFGGAYITLDDPIALADAKSNPRGFLQSRQTPLVIDEVQRAPELFLALKLLVDRDRKPGQYLLTGSSNVLLLPKVADSLAGRMEPVDLMPLCQAEASDSLNNWVDQVFSDAQPKPSEFKSMDLPTVIERGGFPEPFQRKSADRREAWYQSYVRTILDRDVRDLANISGLTQLPRLLALLASRSGKTLNIASLSVETGVPHTTLTRYIDLFRALFLTVHVPAWSANVDTRLAKSPKAFLVDTGLLCYLTGMDSDMLRRDRFRYEDALQTFVANELSRLASASRTRPSLCHLRTVKQKEVDFVLEGRDGRIVGVEVIPEKAVTPEHLEGLRYLQELTEDRYFRGVLLYEGDEFQQIDTLTYAAPISSLWS